MGKIDSDGSVRANGRLLGKVESDGDVRKSGRLVGKIDNDGDVRENGKLIGTAKGVPKRRAAVLFFFDLIPIR